MLFLFYFVLLAAARDLCVFLLVAYECAVNTSDFTISIVTFQLTREIKAISSAALRVMISANTN